MKKTIVLLTGASVEYGEIADLVEPNKKKWCKRWGVEYRRVLFNGEDTWGKVKVWRDHLKTCDWLFWQGADTLITNLSIGPNEFIERDSDFMFSCIDLGLQGDVFIARKTKSVLKMLKWASKQRLECHTEEEAIARYLSSHKRIRVEVVPQHKLNATPNEPFYRNRSQYRSDRTHDYWEPGDFLVHFHAMPLEKRIKLIKDKYLKLVVK